MRQTPVSDFTRNLVGFVVFLAVSFSVTIGASLITSEQTQQEQVAAAAARMLETIK